MIISAQRLTSFFFLFKERQTKAVEFFIYLEFEIYAVFWTIWWLPCYIQYKRGYPVILYLLFFSLKYTYKYISKCSSRLEISSHSHHWRVPPYFLCWFGKRLTHTSITSASQAYHMSHLCLFIYCVFTFIKINKCWQNIKSVLS